MAESAVHPLFTIEDMTNSLAYQLKEIFPGVKCYMNPNQQGTVSPCFFIQYAPGSGIERETHITSWKRLNVELIYEDDFNLPDLYERYLRVAERLDNVAYFHYIRDIDEQTHCYIIMEIDRREWTVSLPSLVYKFTLEIRLYDDPDRIKMRTKELNPEVRD